MNALQIDQPEVWFFDPSFPPTDEEKRYLVGDKNPNNPFNRMVGNKAAKDTFSVLIYDALGKVNHRVDVNVALIGPSGVGKTTFARASTEVLDIPFIDINPEAVSNAQDIFNLIQEKLSQTDDGEGGTLEMIKQSDGSYYAPTCCVFIDEVHQLGSLSQCLLTATERKTHTLAWKGGKLDTTAIWWQIGTTDRGLLFDAFDTRFMKIDLLPYSREEIANIVYLQNDHLIPPASCRLIAKYYGLITREANAAATMVVKQKGYSGCSWEDVVELVRRRDGIDDFGLSRKRLEVLTVLGSGRRSLATLASLCNVKVEEMTKYILPPLSRSIDGNPPLVESGPGGQYITRQGLNELDKRGISHSGENVLTKWAA